PANTRSPSRLAGARRQTSDRSYVRRVAAFDRREGAVDYDLEFRTQRRRRFGSGQRSLGLSSSRELVRHLSEQERSISSKLFWPVCRPKPRSTERVRNTLHVEVLLHGGLEPPFPGK